ncbi:MAG: sulfotransferase domain-containing protein [Bacteroidales bacterium]|nr:sulfotransferase domain-containing protein [Bacteroidales bacterium]
MERDNRKIVWIASYPKSGNTWFRLVLSHLLEKNDIPLNINNIYSASIASSRVHFDNISGVSGSDLTSEEIDAIRPEIYRRMAVESEDLIFKKVHDAWTINEAGKQIFPTDITKAVVYMIRNPLDVAVSYAFHSGTNFANIIEDMSNSKHALADKPGKLHNQLRQKLLNWSEHVISWIDSSGMPVKVIRYEDLIENPFKEFSTAFNFIGMNYEAEDLIRAIKNSEFSKVSQQEEKFGFKEKPLQMSLFFRKGEPGDWKNHLSVQLADEIRKKHSDIMKRFNYL